MRPQVVKKGWRRILHLPKLLKSRIAYTQRIAISWSMMQVSDSCDSGWNKLYGISFGHHHWHSSYRFVFRNKGGEFVLGYYAYIDGVSPQVNKSYKGAFNFKTRIMDRDTIKISILHINRSTIRMYVIHEQSGEGHIVDLPYPKKYKWATWLRTELYPNLKCKQDQLTTFQFLRPIGEI